MFNTLHDALGFTSMLSRRRVANIWKNYYSYKKAIRTRDPEHPALPFSISIEPTTSCNLRCPECPSGLRSFTRPTGMMLPETFKTIIDELHETLAYLILYFQGEPFLNPNFFDLVRYAADKKIYTATSTNAHFLNQENTLRTIESGLSRLIISMDGTDQKSYETYRIGGNLEKVLDGVKNLTAFRKKLRTKSPYLILQFLMFQHNIQQIPEIRKIARELGVDKLEFKTAQVYNYEKGSKLIPEREQFSRYRKQTDGSYQIKNDLQNKCWKMWHSCVITWDGDVVPCCFDKDASYRMGNVRNESFASIWNSDKYRSFRSRLFRGRKEIDICTNCTEGLQF